MTSSDAPRPPGGPLREDAPEGVLQPGDDDLDHLAEGSSESESGSESESESGSDRLPGVSQEPEQSEEAAELQQENAETSLDQPST